MKGKRWIYSSYTNNEINLKPVCDFQLLWGGGETFIRIDDLFTYPPDIILFPLVAIPYTWNFLINHSQNKSFNLYIISLCLLSCIFRYIANIFLLIKLKRWKLYSLLHPGKLPSCPHWTEPPHILILIISASSSGKKNLYEVLFWTLQLI